MSLKNEFFPFEMIFFCVLFDTMKTAPDVIEFQLFLHFGIYK